ncbi:hypothetical protein AAFF_G00337480 [Aldrovandia affinis]|uniref:Uncharacterized protein n=1 Tax=Aldrovandia affinis TaxID=143900 RepID=A0AAD7SMZ5_9TELE|nr:hypothetical protein AAFF_G00337480 [Aldrovandia affinis]
MSTNAQARTPALLHRTTQTYRCVLTEHLQALISCSDLMLLLSAPVRVPRRRCQSLGAVKRRSACPRDEDSCSTRLSRCLGNAGRWAQLRSSEAFPRDADSSSDRATIEGTLDDPSHRRPK